MTTIALIVGAGSGLSAAIARLFAAEGITVALAARQIDKLQPLAETIGANLFTCDATQPDAVEQLFTQVEQQLGTPTTVIYNAGLRTPGAFIEVSATNVVDSLMVNAYGGFLVAQAAAKRMIPLGKGAIFLTGLLPASKGILGLRLSQWGNLPCEDWPKVLPVNWHQKIFMWRIL